MRKRNLSMWITLMLGLQACGDNTQTSSSPLVTDIEHTDVKRQSIGNCWLYAAATWAESLHLSATESSVDISESYWTWWHWHDQIVGSSREKISTGGNWWTSTRIILEHGVVMEAEFIPEESDAQMSYRQKAAERYVNRQLREGGTLAERESRTPENVRRVLDEAFETDMVAAEELARPTDEFLVGTEEDAAQVLSEALNGDENQRWTYVSYPRAYGKETNLRAWRLERRHKILRAVMAALNDYQPVVMSTMIDFNALDRDDNGSFKWETLEEAGETGSQGGHMIVLEDYTVKNVPGYGELGRGDLSPEEKEAALDGELTALITKNSWGTDRADRGIIDGYTSFDMDYLNAQWDWDTYPDSESYYTTLSAFIVPPGY